MEKQNHKRLFAVLAAMLVMFSLVFTTGATAGVTAFADSAEYTSVIADLAKDENFNAADYPADAKDYSLQVIQIAESTEKELFVYVYQPSALAFNMLATTIRFSQYFEGGTWIDYPLRLLSSAGVFAKFKVEDFKVSDKSTRYYNIAAIHREWNKIIDGGLNTDNHDAEIAVEVAQCWTVATINGNVTYSMEKADVVVIENPFFGTVRYKDGQGWWNSYAVDSHFIAFSTDWDIEALLEVDVSYQYAVKKNGVWSSSESEPQSDLKTVTYDQYGGTTGEHSFNSTQRTWDKIAKASEFAASCEPLDEQARKEVALREWVVCFLETDYEDYTGGMFGWINAIGAFLGANNTSSCTVVSKVTILRLKFISEGKPYNLGAVSNKGGKSPLVGDDSTSFWKDFWNSIKDGIASIPWWVWLILGVVIFIVVIVLLCKFAPAFVEAVLRVLGKVFVAIGKALWWLICLPFRGIKALIDKRKGNDGGGKKGKSSGGGEGEEDDESGEGDEEPKPQKRKKKKCKANSSSGA